MPDTQAKATHTPPPILVRIEVYDHRTGEHVIDEGFNTNAYDVVQTVLDKAKRHVEDHAAAARRTFRDADATEATP